MESESDTEVNDDTKYPISKAISFDDMASSSEAGSQLPSLNNDHHKPEFIPDDSAANSLVEAALDKDEAKDRHVRFQDHVVESAALVQRMLSAKRGSIQITHDPLQAAIQNRHEDRIEEEEISLEPMHPTLGGGSVLASLMKLEASRKQESPNKKKKRSKVNV